MRPTELAKIYLMSFFGHKPLDDLRPILAETLAFTGPFYTYHTAEDFIQSLRETLPDQPMAYEILQDVEKANSCCLVYKSNHQGVDETMAQLFEVNDDKITRIRLILDGSKLLKKA